MKYKELKNEKAITLVALVVTIIVLLILAGVAISLSIGENGIFKRAENVVDIHKEASENEVQTMNELANLIDQYGENANSNPKLKVGDYVEYVPETTEKEYNLKKEVSGNQEDQLISQDTKMNWRVLNINTDGTVDIIGDATEEGISLGGAIGYNNGVYVLNDICKRLYSNNTLGLNARSIKLEDIENKLNELGIQSREEYINPYETKYNETNNYKNAIYPALYEKERGSGITGGEANKDGIGVSESYYNVATNETTKEAGEKGLTITNSYYSLTNSDYYDNENLYNLLFKENNNYWIASRVLYDTKDMCVWGLRTGISGPFTQYDENAQFSPLHTADSEGALGTYYSGALSLRPIITIGTNIKLENGDGTINNPWKLVK